MKRILAVFVAMLVVTGCATVTHGTSEEFVIETTPPSARATLSNGLTCTTPCSLTVPRRGDFVVTIESDGFETVRRTIASSADGGGGGFSGNVRIAGVSTPGIESGSGAPHSHKPNPLVVTLIPIGATPEEIAALMRAAQESAEEGAEEAPDDIAGSDSPE